MTHLNHYTKRPHQSDVGDVEQVVQGDEGGDEPQQGGW